MLVGARGMEGKWPRLRSRQLPIVVAELIPQAALFQSLLGAAALAARRCFQMKPVPGPCRSSSDKSPITGSKIVYRLRCDTVLIAFRHKSPPDDWIQAFRGNITQGFGCVNVFF